MKVLVVAAHPDDEVLGCGATIAKHSNMGDTVHVLILAEGITSRGETRKRKDTAYDLDKLKKAAHDANKILGVSDLCLHNFPDNKMDSIDQLDIVKVIEKFVKKCEPDIIYTHHGGDINIDHRITHQAVSTVCRPMPGSRIKTLLFFEVLSSTEWQIPGVFPNFAPNWFIDVSSTLCTKIKALKKYSSEMRTWPHPRSIETVKYLAKYRGSTVGVEAAEAFMLGRKIE